MSGYATTEAVNQARRDVITSRCQKIEPEEYFEYKLKSWKNQTRNKPVIKAVVENQAMKIFYCVVNKAGCTSTVRFFTSMNSNRKLARYNDNIENGKVALHLETSDFFRARPRSLGIGIKHNSIGRYRNIITMPLKPAIKKYKNWQKLLIVRHPLQRLVSAYFQTSKWLHVTSFRDFIQNEVLRGEDEHWLDYQHSCHPCLLDYDFVLHQETIDYEFPYFSHSVGLNPEYPYPRANVNRKVVESNSSMYSQGYDDMLRDLELKEPKLFHQVLEKYKVDMEMFGYQWRNHRSGGILENGGSYATYNGKA